jgi:predicted HicB family RNase H-like nuclease
MPVELVREATAVAAREGMRLNAWVCREVTRYLESVAPELLEEGNAA